MINIVKFIIAAHIKGDADIGIASKDSLVIKGTRYYLSNRGDDGNDGLSPETAWATLDGFHARGDFLKPGDAVLFERGSKFRMKRGIVLSDGVSYGAFGEGPKPELIGCDRNYADPALWEKTDKENLWVLEMPTSVFVGNVVFNDGQEVGILKGELEEVRQDFDYYFDAPAKKLYLYMSAGCPGELFENIEVCIRNAIFSGLLHAHDIVIDNLCMKYTAAGGIEFNYGYIHDIAITNCEIGWTGGAYLWDGSQKIRGGNSIGFWNDCRNVQIANNWIYQCYDAAVSPQGDPGMVCDQFEVSGNLIEYCTWSYEQWVGKSQGMMRNNRITDNIMRLAGYGWASTQRPDADYNAHFNAWSYHLTDCFENYVFANNILDCSSHALVAWHWEEGSPEHEGFQAYGNTYYQKSNEKNLAMWYGYSDSYLGRLTQAHSQEELEAAVKPFDKAPKLVKWLG